MRLYRVTATSRDESPGVFYDATSSLTDAIQMAKVIQRHSPEHDVTVEAEMWPGLSWWKYQLHRATGTHEGFGVNFMNKHGLTIQHVETVWPASAKGKA